jgi:hypothetical protein
MGGGEDLNGGEEEAQVVLSTSEDKILEAVHEDSITRRYIILKIEMIVDSKEIPPQKKRILLTVKKWKKLHTGHFCICSQGTG